MTSPGIDESPEYWQNVIAEALSADPAETFAAAWGAADPATSAGRITRLSLESTAFGSPSLLATLNALTGRQDRIELVLSGHGVVDHSTSAEKLGTLFRAWSRAVKEIAKAANNRVRLPDALLATALAPGSVRVVFEIKPTPPPKNALTIHSADAIQNIGLRTLVSVLEQAADEASTTLDATVHSLKAPARKSVRAVARVIAEAGWEIDGELQQRDGRTAPVSISLRSASRILDATTHKELKIERATHAGYVDTWSWSRQTMRLEISDGGSVEAYVPPDLAQQVAQFNADHSARVLAKFEVLITIPTGDTYAAKRSYTLVSIAMDSVQPELSVDL